MKSLYLINNSYVVDLVNAGELLHRHFIKTYETKTKSYLFSRPLKKLRSTLTRIFFISLKLNYKPLEPKEKSKQGLL